MTHTSQFVSRSGQALDSAAARVTLFALRGRAGRRAPDRCHAPPARPAPAAAGEPPAARTGRTGPPPPAASLRTRAALPRRRGRRGRRARRDTARASWAFLSRIANFVILAGGLVYLLRSPLGKYLGARAEQIRLDLVTAADTRRTASEELARIEARMKALPAEIEALKTAWPRRGAGRAGAHQASRRRRTRPTPRTGQARDRPAGRRRAPRPSSRTPPTSSSASRARRVEREITDTDRSHLVDRYVAQVKTAHD